MTNIDVFDLCVADIFVRLYESFPVPIDLDFSEAPDSIFEEYESSDGAFDKLVIYEKTILWLSSAGYISFESTSYDGGHGVVFTPKGLEIMKLPSSLEVPGASLGEQLMGSLKTGALQAAGNIAKSAITQGLSIAVANA